MKLVKLLRVILMTALVVSSAAGGADYSDDTFIFNQPPGVNSSAPNILFILDNTTDWNNNAQNWVGVGKQGDAEVLEIAKFVKNLTKPVNIGLMMFTLTGQQGGYVRYGIRDMTVPNNSIALQNLLNGISPVSGSANTVGPNKDNFANTLYETWLYLNGANSFAGMDPQADFAGNGAQSGAVPSPGGPFPYQSNSAGARYNLPPSAGGCAKTYIVFIGNNKHTRSIAAPTQPTDPAIATLTKYKYSTSPDIQSAWTRFLRLRPDLTAGSAAAANGSVITYTIDAYNSSSNQNDPTFTAVLKNMARNGGGKYYQAGSDSAIAAALQDIFNQIMAVNSVFASVSLPVSVSVRGTYLNQVYLGMFRPDASARPNWVGNLKQYQLAADTMTTPPTVYLADKLGAAAENKVTGFVNPGATSFWTTASTFWDPNYYVNSQGVGGNSDAPDGDLVEKGGTAQYLRTKFATTQVGRAVYTCTGCANGDALSKTPFSTNNASITSAMLGLQSPSVPEPVINWVRGGNTLVDDPPVANPSNSYNIRGFAHGDVLHSRPAVINYNRTTDDVVVFYGANDGMLHAVKGGQGANGGNELWSLVLPEHINKNYLTRLYNHSPTISSSSPKPYFVDGSATVYTYSSANDGVIDYTRGDKAYIFLTMRRGGQFIYALDVSDPSTPKLLWKHSNADSGFSELGMSWSDLRVARLRASTDPVLIFGLGYDSAANDTITQGTATMGRGVMVLNATNGSIIWQVNPSTVSTMSYAVPANIALYDSDRDGYVDRLYVADTGANIWRINVSDASTTKWTVSLLAALGGSGANARKFLYAPDIIPATALNPTDTLLIGSGDREHPFDTNIQNRYYMIKDNHGLNAVPSSPITEANLYDATANLVQVGTAQQVKDANSALSSASGWYVTLGTGEKAVSGSTTLAGTVLFTTNTPATSAANACTGNLGEARIYMLNYLNGAATMDVNGSQTLTTVDRYEVRAGGGFPPTPVPVSVKIGSNIYQVAISGTQVITPPGLQMGRRYRVFWRRSID
ncbi:pilus assembly protein PilY [Cupriavidus necator]|uniref:Pilus assembly protein PilY n=1 Tax=Cupriavidus necator TaxID=106590 RepID=A0A1U9UKL7_CUPNE|nr:PilC/PilY family type IV pilus protein [Cupriavidus necator]AQV92781.1 pilus assembly protein PilY [Cupriavidus necator]